MKLDELIEDTVHTDWKELLLSVDSSKLEEFLTQQEDIFRNNINIYPPRELIFNAFNQFNMADTSVCIIGQDCYHQEGQAMGLCFSVPDNIKIPPSLRNIYKEIHDDMGTDISQRTGDLTHWAEQGVLMLNSALTVIDSKPNSHQKQWTPYTDEVIRQISEQLDGIVFILWGKHAQDKIKLIDTDKHHIIKGVHPSPLSASRGFFGCKHFSKCNGILKSIGKEEIDW